MVSWTCSWMGETGKYLVWCVQGETMAEQREFVTGQEQRERNIYTSGESPSKVSSMLRGPLNFETWLPSSHEIWESKAFITAAVSLLFHLGEEIQDRFL